MAGQAFISRATGAGGTEITDTLTFTSTGLITTTSGNLTIEPVGGYTQIGSSFVSNRGLSGVDDFGVNGSVEINGSLNADGNVYANLGLTVAANATFKGNVVLWDQDNLAFGTTADCYIRWSVSQTPNTLNIGLGADSNHMIICQKADMTTDYAYGLEDDPTIFIKSSDSGTAAEYLRITWDEITTGASNLTLAPASGYYTVLSSIKTDTGDPTGVEGLIYINTFDNVIKMYADGGWRTLASGW